MYMWFDVRLQQKITHAFMQASIALYESIPLHPFRFASHSKTIVKQKGE